MEVGSLTVGKAGELAPDLGAVSVTSRDASCGTDIAPLIRDMRSSSIDISGTLYGALAAATASLRAACGEGGVAVGAASAALLTDGSSTLAAGALTLTTGGEGRVATGAKVVFGGETTTAEGVAAAAARWRP